VSDKSKLPPWQEAHEKACAEGKYAYVDPETGTPVFTKLKHLERGFCCQSGCRHCAYGFTALESKPREK
jgi:hypothetical protein